MVKISRQKFKLWAIGGCAFVLVASCVPKAVDKKATCGTTKSFNSVTRSCGTTDNRYLPVATKSSDSVTEDTAKTITLTYTDKNKDLASSCRVTSTSSKVEMVSPLVSSGQIFSEADNVYTSANNLVAVIPAGADAVTAATALADSATALSLARKSFNYSQVIVQLTEFSTQVETILSLAANYPANVSVQTNAALTLSLYNDYSDNHTMAVNRCACTGGVCTTEVAPKLHQAGTAGFSYAISDLDGEGNLKPVILTISAMSTSTAHLKPIAKSSYSALTESETSTADSYAVTIGGAKDISSTLASSFSYTFSGTKNGSNQGVTTNGIVTGCMDLTGSTSSNDTTCIYTPNDGDDYDTNTPAKASVIIGDLTYTAVSEGTVGNNFTVQYFNLQNDLLAEDPYVSDIEKFGLISTIYNESFIRMDGNNIKIFINKDVTSSSDIADLVNFHPQASQLVLVTGGGIGVFPNPVALTPASVSLAGGVDGYDKIAFTASNGATSSTNSANIMVKIASQDDVPVMNFVASTSLTKLEDTNPISIDLTSTYTDVDTGEFTYVNTCNVDPADATFLSNFTVNSCTCTIVLSVKTCTLSLTPDSDVSSTSAYTFSYRIGSFDGTTTQYTDYRTFSLTMTPINDPPEISIAALPTITAIPDDTIAEGGSDYVDVYIGPGGGGFETSQTVTLTATSSDTALLPNANIVIGDTVPAVTGKKRITYTPAAYKSGTATITVTATDNGGTTNGGDNETQDPFVLTVTFVDNNPVFASSITKVETNEGGYVQSDGFEVDEDLGSTADEDNQQITVTAITSDNAAVIPNTNITLFYDLNDNGVADVGEERDVGAVGVGDALDAAGVVDVSAHKFYLKLDPVDGISGNANIAMTISDGTNTTTTNFSLIVYPIAAIHGGWKNIAATGIKTDKDGYPISEDDIKCNYNKTTDTSDCSGANCTGTSAPHGAIVPDAANVLFWDSANKKCYRSTGTTAFTWVDLKTSCPITRTSGMCSNENCIGSATPVGSVTPTKENQYYYNSATETCYISTDITSADWEVYVPSVVTLEWQSFALSGSGSESSVQIDGYSVFRREAGEDYNLKTGHLQSASSTAVMSITDPSVRTFTDTTAVAGKIYYYSVRPVDSNHSLPTYSPEIFSEIRVVAPPPNYAFVHRWMMNQEICQSMNMSTTSTTPGKIHPTENFRCEYEGPGSSGGYYDIGQDYLVDMNEMGCPYTASPTCSANGCIGIGAPSTNEIDGTIYYNRGSGVCYLREGGAWVTMEAADKTLVTSDLASVVSNFVTALNPPLVKVSRLEAIDICATRTAPIVTGLVLPNARLPEKKEYVAYSSHPTSLSNTDIADLEQGFSLDVESRCNGTSANGISSAYSDASIPSTSFIYSLPGTATSGIKSLYTGSIPWALSKGTESCVSRFGIQDLYGNVSEWVKDTMSCMNSNFVCNSIAGTDLYYDFYAGDYYGFDYTIGPFNDSNASSSADVEDGFLTDWTFADELFNGGKFSLPLAMPISSDIATTYTGIDALDFILDIGPSSGITTARLHEDGIYVNSAMHTLSSVNALAVKTALTQFITLETKAISTIEEMEALDWNIGTANEVAAYASALDFYNSIEDMIDLFPGITAAVNAYNSSVIAETYRTLVQSDPTQYSTAATQAATAMGYVVSARTQLAEAITASQTAAVAAMMTAANTLDAALTTAGGADETTIRNNAFTAADTAATNVNGNYATYISNASAAANVTNSATVGLSVGGSYLSGARSGRFTSETILEGNTRPDVGFRCVIPINKVLYPADAGRHTYSY